MSGGSLRPGCALKLCDVQLLFNLCLTQPTAAYSSLPPAATEPAVPRWRLCFIEQEADIFEEVASLEPKGQWPASLSAGECLIGDAKAMKERYGHNVWRAGRFIDRCQPAGTSGSTECTTFGTFVRTRLSTPFL